MNRNPSLKELRQFAALLAVGGGLLGAWLWMRGHPVASGSLAAAPAAAAAALLCAGRPRAGRLIYIGWMSVGAAIGSVVTTLVLLVLYFGLMTPVALIFRLLRRDALGLRRKPDAGTYWVDHPALDEQTYYDHLY